MCACVCVCVCVCVCACVCVCVCVFVTLYHCVLPLVVFSVFGVNMGQCCTTSSLVRQMQRGGPARLPVAHIMSVVESIGLTPALCTHEHSLPPPLYLLFLSSSYWINVPPPPPPPPPPLPPSPPVLLLLLLLLLLTIYYLLQVFVHVASDSVREAEYQLTAMITYYGHHYSTFCHHTVQNTWIYFDMMLDSER